MMPTPNTQRDLDKVRRCDACHRRAATVFRVTDHVCFCQPCLDKYGMVKV